MYLQTTQFCWSSDPRQTSAQTKALQTADRLQLKPQPNPQALKIGQGDSKIPSNEAIAWWRLVLESSVNEVAKASGGLRRLDRTLDDTVPQQRGA